MGLEYLDPKTRYFSFALEANGSTTLLLPPCIMSKAGLNAYTRILAKKYPNMSINNVQPGSVLSVQT
ncbi:NAD(P)-binding domain containing protein [Trema orientale]|uniref:NAD(P)-binding domain containing protein n=1 Tax=Trema orientale TaxID=63057 RepID=A0A2P5FUF4_TREOI|nr:NAD(P)-binding domain containing protein [Trema orientale]